MSESDGGQIGPYTITREIGRGGMGVVYLARDTKLDRDVAIKALPAELAQDEDRLARFEREARTLASLNHPNIGAIYGLEEVDGRRYLILEYVEGETLAERLKRGTMPTDDALDTGLQIASAIEAAHEKGVVHRDLKPANIKLITSADGDMQVKVLDFGLAKALGEEPSVASNLAHSPTIAGSPTIPGVILGTAGYLSPEQARGRPVDKRTDIFAFGCVLYEMLTGEGSFGGETVTDSIAATIHKEPEWDRLPPDTPPLVRHLLARCMAKDRRQRLHDIADARIEIEAILRDPKSGRHFEGAASEGGRSLLAPITLTAIVCLAAGVAATQLLTPSTEVGPASAQPRKPVHFEIDTSELGTIALPENSADVAISRDGRRIAFEYWIDDTSGIAYRDLDSNTLHRIEAADGGGGPFFSPDGETVGFWRDGRLWRVSLAGGPATSICEAPGPNGSIAWLDTNQIVFVGFGGDPLSIVSATGGEPEVLARADRAMLHEDRAQPIRGFENVAALPGDRGVLVSGWDGNSIEDYDIVHVSLDTGKVTHVVERATNPTIINDEFVVFVRDSSLVAVPFDFEAMRPTGAERVVLVGVRTTGWGSNAQFDVSAGGTLVYVPGRRVAEGRRLVRVDRDGNASPIAEPDALTGHIDVSSNGRTIVMGTLRQQIELWTYDLERGVPSLFSNVGESMNPVFSPDGTKVAFLQILEGEAPTILSKEVGGSGELQQLFRFGAEREGEPVAWSPDGRHLLLLVAPPGAAGAQDIVALDIESKEEPRPVLRLRSDEDYASFSPDGKWVAFDSNEPGRNEVFITRFSSDGRKWQVSIGGGRRPRWSSDGAEIFFVGANALKSASIEFTDDGQPVIGEPVTLFDMQDRYSLTAWDIFDVFPNGDFLMIEPAPWEREGARLNVIVGWGDELQRQFDNAAK